MTGTDIEITREPGGEDYRDEFVIEEVMGEPPEEHREEIYRCYKGRLWDIFHETKRTLARAERADGEG